MGTGQPWQVTDEPTHHRGGLEGKALTSSASRDAASLAERYKEPGAWAAWFQAPGNEHPTLVAKCQVKPKQSGRGEGVETNHWISVLLLLGCDIL